VKKDGVIFQAANFSSWSRRMNCEWMPTVPRGFAGSSPAANRWASRTASMAASPLQWMNSVAPPS
jgi:hypothetical protein